MSGQALIRSKVGVRAQWNQKPAYDALNRAVAVVMRDGPEASLALIEPLLPALPGYPSLLRLRLPLTSAVAPAGCMEPRRTTELLRPWRGRSPSAAFYCAGWPRWG